MRLGRPPLLVGRLMAVAVLAMPALGTSAEERSQRTLALDEALERALSRNFAIAIERESYSAAASVVRREQGAYDFELGWGASFEKLTDPVNSLLSGAPTGSVAPDLKSLDIDASLSRLLPSGGSVSFLASGGRARTNSSFALLSPSYMSSLSIEVRQPLLRNRAIDVVRRRIRVARSERDRSLAGLKRAVADTLAAVEVAYWNLTAAQREVEVRDAAVVLAAQQLDETRARIRAGTLPENEEAQPRAELERRKGEEFSAREQASRAENALKALILDAGDDPLWGLRLVASDQAEGQAVSLDVAAALASGETRPEIDEAKAGLASRTIDLRGARDEVKPRLDAYASYARRGLAGTLNPAAQPIAGQPIVFPGALDGLFARSLGTLADGLYPDLRIGLSLTVPIGNRAAKAGVAIAEAEERRAAADLARVRQAVRVEVLNAGAAVDVTSERIGAARAAREAAEVQFRSEQERFAVGMSTNFLVLTRQNDLSRARLEEIQALSDHRKALTELQRASGRLLKERHVVVAEDAPLSGASGGPK